MADSIPGDSDAEFSYLTLPRRKALAVALLMLGVLLATWWGAHVWYRGTLLTELRGDVLAELDPYGNALTIDLQRRFDLIYGFGAWVSTVPSRAELAEKFDSFARQLSQSVVGVRNLSIAPGGVAALVYPRAGNEAILGLNLFNDNRAEVREDAARASESRKIVISGPYEMRVGGFGAVARLAIYRQDKFWGFVNVALDLPPILEEVGITSQQSMQLALRDRRGRVFFGNPQVFQDKPIVHRVALPEGQWDLAAIPIEGWNRAIRRHMAIFDGGALASILCLSAIAYLLAFRDARLAARVAQRTRALDAELWRRGVIERQLRFAEERYHTLVEVNPDAVLVNQNQRIVFANPAAVRLFGAKSSDELLGRSPFDFVRAENRPEVAQRYQQALATGAPNPPRIQPRLRVDGTTIYVETTAAPLVWEGSPAVQVVMRDVTEQRRVEGWMRSLIETTQDALVAIDRQGKIALFNPAAERIFGYPHAEMIGKNVQMLMPEPYRSEHAGYIERYERTGMPQAIGKVRNVMAQRKNGEVFPVELAVTAIPSDQEVQYGAFIRDISEKVRLQEQAFENERLATVGAMAAKFGHELGNPLNGMSLTIQLLEQRLRKQVSVLDESTLATLARLKSEISRLSALLQDFRSLSRKESFDFQSAQLAQLVSEAIAMELPRYAERGVTVQQKFPSDLPKVRVDIDKMKQVILNLAKNAVEAMPTGGELSFAGSAGVATATLEVSDTGAGIPSEVDVFAPFYTTKSFGTGIGMTVVRQILAAHGAKISYRSQVGKGTTFSIELPLA